MTQPTNKQDIVAVGTQRHAIGAMIRKASQEPPCAPPKKPPASALTRQRPTSPSTEAPTPGTASAPPAPAQNSGPLTESPARDPEGPRGLGEGNPVTQAEEPTDEDPPAWAQQASLSELLLWRLGIPVDRERIEREHQAEDGIDLKPPITTRKVADAIAHLSLQVMRGELDPTSAKTSLYALQTLLTALRLQIIEDKKPKDARKKPRTTRRKKRNAKRQR